MMPTSDNGQVNWDEISKRLTSNILEMLLEIQSMKHNPNIILNDNGPRLVACPRKDSAVSGWPTLGQECKWHCHQNPLCS